MRTVLTAMDKLPTVADVEVERFIRLKHGHTMADREVSMVIANKMNADDRRDARIMADRTQYQARIHAVLRYR